VSSRRAAKRRLRIVTDVASLHMLDSTADESVLASDPQSDSDSLFDADSLLDDVSSPGSISLDDTAATSELLKSSCMAILRDADVPAQRTAPPIPGLFFDPALLLPEDLAEDVMWTCIRTYFQHSGADQVMLFERTPPDPLSLPSEEASPVSAGSGLPPILLTLLATLASLLEPLLPASTHALLFPPPSSAPTLARQAILNLYWPGDGITPHVDLLDRYGDGIIGVSFGSGCVMRFDKLRGAELAEDVGAAVDVYEPGKGSAEGRDRWDLYLPARSVVVMSADARYRWTHGIEKRMDDLVDDPPESLDTGRCCQSLPRGVRLSVTFRWLLPGADVVGEPEPVQDAR